MRCELDQKDINWNMTVIYRLPDKLREDLKRSVGELLSEQDIERKLKNRIIAVVGDMATATLYDKGISPKLAIVDFKCERKSSKKLNEKISRVPAKIVKVSNPKGVLTDELWHAVERAYADTENTRIEVDGEEDLAALACIYFAPENSAVLYGLPQKGLAAITVTKKEKKLVSDVLTEMEA